MYFIVLASYISVKQSKDSQKAERMLGQPCNKLADFTVVIYLGHDWPLITNQAVE